ncbi:hypothetical protein [Arthrobacter sp. MYb213]|uniref:hypothetical protein n=1 Tax=Arthrobacter sp. MYb213 TaxID=1848595 RepID=UPI000CFD01C7|nr:hypothetical protein [Arthrobacter sp. MYb213]PRB72778.1 hypothetical protein CQ011_03905 [Arthrobacter sp. MYb213]
MNEATHLLIHRYRPGTGPQPPSEDFDEEMLQWEALDTRLKAEGVLISSFALQDRGILHTPDSTLALDTEAEIIFAVHAIKVGVEHEAQEFARLMPHLDYGSVEIRPLMD